MGKIIKILLAIFLSLAWVDSYAYGKKQTRVLECSPNILRPRDTLSIKMLKKHPPELAIVNPAGEWIFLQGLNIKKPLISKREFQRAQKITLRTGAAMGTFFADGIERQRKIFESYGAYIIYLAENLETELENTLFFTCKVNYAKGGA